MNEQIINLLIAVSLATIPNIIIKYAEKYAEKVKPRDDLTKSSIDVAGTSLDACKSAIEVLRNHNAYLNERLDFKKEELTASDNLIKKQRASINKQVELIDELTKKLKKYKESE